MLIEINLYKNCVYIFKIFFNTVIILCFNKAMLQQFTIIIKNKFNTRIKNVTNYTLPYLSEKPYQQTKCGKTPFLSNITLSLTIINKFDLLITRFYS